MTTPVSFPVFDFASAPAPSQSSATPRPCAAGSSSEPCASARRWPSTVLSALGSAQRRASMPALVLSSTLGEVGVCRPSASLHRQVEEPGRRDRKVVVMAPGRSPGAQRRWMDLMEGVEHRWVRQGGTTGPPYYYWRNCRCRWTPCGGLPRALDGASPRKPLEPLPRASFSGSTSAGSRRVTYRQGPACWRLKTG